MGSDALEAVVAQVRGVLPAAAVITDRQRLRTYECDGLAHYRVVPALVVLPETAKEVAALSKAVICSWSMSLRPWRPSIRR